MFSRAQVHSCVLRQYSPCRRVDKSFRSYGVDARYIFAATPPAERKELVSAFRQGDFPVLVNCGGYNIKFNIISSLIKIYVV